DTVLVDEGLLDRGFHRLEVAQHGGKPVMNGEQAAGQRLTIRRLDRSAADEGQTVAVAFDNAPAGAAEPRIDAEDTNGTANRLRDHGTVIAARRHGRNRNRTPSPHLSFAGSLLTTCVSRPASPAARPTPRNWRTHSARRRAR